MNQKLPKLSASPERNTFQRDSYIERQIKEGHSIDDPDVRSMIDWYNSWNKESEKREADPEWQKNNLEYDLRITDWVVAKVRASESYAQNIYAALCNQDWQRNDVWPVLKDERWSCSWRSAGGIVANLRGEGDYIDWYCSGLGGLNQEYDAKETNEEWQKRTGYVPEGTVTDEIREDFARLGWVPVDTDDEAY